MALKAGYKGIKKFGPGLKYDNVNGILNLEGESDLSLDNLKDVAITTPIDGDILAYDATGEVWENVQPDSDPTEDSANLVTSGGVYEALQDRVDWESYAKTGVHNILPIPSSVVSSGIFTVNRDSNGNVTSIDVNGTPTADQDLNIGSASNPLPISLISNGDILSKGNELPVIDLLQQIWYYDSSKNYLDYQNESSVGCSVNNIIINIPSGAAYFVINNKAKANKALNTSLYPMIRLASDTDSTYAPYAMTNQQLTESLTNNTLITTGLTYNKCSYVSGGYCKVGSLVQVCIIVEATDDLPAWTNIISGIPLSPHVGSMLSVKNLSNNNYYQVDAYDSSIRVIGNTVSSGQELQIGGTYLCIS